jgi:hypothetical protein
VEEKSKRGLIHGNSFLALSTMKVYIYKKKRKEEAKLSMLK